MTAQEIQTATANMKKQGIDALKDLSVSDLSDIMKNPAARKAFMRLRISMSKQSKTRGIKSVDTQYKQPKDSILMSYDNAMLFLKLQYLMASTNLYGANKSDEMYVFQTECALASIQEAIDGRLESRLRTSKSYGDPIYMGGFGFNILFSPMAEVGFSVQTSGSSGYFKSLSSAIYSELMARGRKKRPNEVIPDSIVKMAEGIVYDTGWQKGLTTDEEIEFGKKLHWARVYNLIVELNYEIASIKDDNRAKDLYNQLADKVQLLVYGG